MLRVRALRPHPEGPTLEFDLSPGESLCVLGTAASGKTALLRALAGWERPASGSFELEAPVEISGTHDFPRRARPQSLVPKVRGEGYASLATEVLSALGLWGCRRSPVEALSASQRAACELVAPLSVGPALLLIEEALDALDPAVFETAWDLLRRRLRAGASAIVVTHRPETVVRYDRALVLKGGEVRFCGHVEALRREASPQRIEVLTQYAPGVRALAPPLEVEIEEVEGGLAMRAAAGQELAARLLREGYGDVRCVVHARPSLEQTIREMLL